MEKWNNCLNGLYWGANKNGQQAWEKHKKAIELFKKEEFRDAFTILVALNPSMEKDYKKCLLSNWDYFWSLVEKVHTVKGPERFSLPLMNN